MASGLVQDLLERRVPQYTAVYLGAGWGLIEFFAFLEDRYLLSPHLTNLVLLLWALLIPSVVLFTYFHGRPGADRWNGIEKVVIPVNIGLTLLVLFLVFSGKQLGAVTTTVSTADEEGNEVERVVPRSEFRKRIAFFPLAAPQDSVWLGEAAMYALATDLYQDMFLDLRVPGHYKELLNQKGLLSASSVPRPLKREIAQELHLGYFVDGEARPIDGGFEMRVGLHDAAGGDAVATHTFRGASLFALVDSASMAVRRALELPERHLQDNPDVPVSELTTESMDAYRHYMLAVALLTYESDYASASTELERAIEIDPTFAEAAFGLYQVQLLAGNGPQAAGALERAMDHLYRLPERVQFAVKAEHYAMRQDLPKAFAVHEMRAELYPQDIQAQLAVAEIRRYQDDLPGAIEALERALVLDPTQSELIHTIGEHHRRLGQLDRAEEKFQRYAERIPDRPDPYLSLGGLYLLKGDHDRARQSYERALLMEPDNVEALVELAKVERYTGRWAEAEGRREAAMAAARTPQERQSALEEMTAYHRYRADYDEAVAYHGRAVEQSRAHLPPIAVVQIEMIGLGDYVRAGRSGEAREKLEALITRLPSPIDSLVVPIGKAELWMALNEPDSLEVAVDQAQRAIAATGFDMLAQRVMYARGRMHELRGAWSQALEAYRRERELAPTDASIPSQIGRVYRRMGDADRAESMLLETLAVWPSHARTNYELGLVYADGERWEDAIRHLERALDTWAIADPDAEFVGAARERLDQARLRLSTVRARG